MNLSRFFIDRPIFAWVIAIVVVLGGSYAVSQLPLEQYPDIAPPTVTINASYPGASAQTIEAAVVQVIEQQMTGVDNLLYMSANSSSAGTASITLTFKAGTNPDTAQVQVQNKVQAANSRLPSTVQQQGVTINKSSSSVSMVVALYSPDGSFSQADIGDYINSNLKDPISRLDGVGQVNAFGSQYAMRVWLDPAKLQKYALMPSDVSTAIAAQNTDLATGALGDLPAVKGQQLNATITARSRLSTPEQFRQIVLKSTDTGARVLLGDVARVELGSEDYTSNSQYNGQPASGIAIELASGANAIAVAKELKTLLAQRAPFFPKGLTWDVAYESTPFVTLSIKEVVHTLIEAIVLVVLIMYLFLQNWRATLIPTLAVPVVLLGTFGVLALLGYSINTLTMFGLVLAIGLLVDDAIVVVENVERVMAEQKLGPLQATRRSMGEISSALIGITMVLSAVLVPMAFFGGSTGIIYRQFSITVVSAMVLSVLVAMTLTPALCATLLRPAQGHGERKGFFGAFNRVFDRGVVRYVGAVDGVLRRRRLAWLTYGAMALLLVGCYWRLPTSFLPTEDQGQLMAMVQMPAGATQQRTLKTMAQTRDYLLKQPGVAGVFAVAGFSFAGSAQNAGMLFIKLKDWSERGADESAEAISLKATGYLMQTLHDGHAFVMQPPAIMGLGSTSGFDLELLDVGGLGHAKLNQAMQQLVAKASADPSLTGVRFNGLADTPQLTLDIDDRKAGALGVGVSDVNSTLSDALGSTYVNDFIDKGRVKKVYMQGDAASRMLPAQISDWYVRNTDGQMVPLSAFVGSRWTTGAPLLGRYNGTSSLEVVGDAASGISSGTAMTTIEKIVADLPSGVSYAWTGMSYQEKLSGNQAPYLYAVSALFVFLCLAALYESWSVPFAVLLVAPLGILGAVLATSLRGLTADVYFQVGLLTTIGLASKNAILIVEFAKQLEAQGQPLVAATMTAVQMRVRPILMTSLAFLLGVTPLVLATGAGAGARKAIGTGVFGGTLVATALGIFFTPLFYVAVRRLFSRRARPGALAGDLA